MATHATVTRSRLTGHWIVTNGGPHRPGSNDPSACGWRRWEDAMLDANERVAKARAERDVREASMRLAEALEHEH